MTLQEFEQLNELLQKAKADGVFKVKYNTVSGGGAFMVVVGSYIELLDTAAGVHRFESVSRKEIIISATEKEES